MSLQTMPQSAVSANVGPAVWFGRCTRLEAGQGVAAIAADADDEASRADRARVPLDRLARLIQRMWLYPAEAALHRGAYETLITRMIRSADTPGMKSELLGVVCHMNRLEYLKALAALRAIAA